MRKLPRPKDEDGNPMDVRTVFCLCITKVGKAALRAKLADVADFVVNESTGYDTHAALGDLHLIVPTVDVNGTVSKKEMMGVYSHQMVPEGKPVNDIHFPAVTTTEPSTACWEGVGSQGRGRSPLPSGK